MMHSNIEIFTTGTTIFYVKELSGFNFVRLRSDLTKHEPATGFISLLGPA